MNRIERTKRKWKRQTTSECYMLHFIMECYVCVRVYERVYMCSMSEYSMYIYHVIIILMKRLSFFSENSFPEFDSLNAWFMQIGCDYFAYTTCDINYLTHRMVVWKRITLTQRNWSNKSRKRAWKTTFAE